MAEDALVEFAGSTGSAAAVREREIVEDEDLTWPQAHLGPDLVKLQALLREERLSSSARVRNSAPHRNPVCVLTLGRIGVWPRAASTIRARLPSTYPAASFRAP